MKVIDVEIEKLIPYWNNPRINDDAVEKVMESIRRFGFRVPIEINPGMVIIDGHTRWEAAKRLGLSSVPCVVMNLTEDEEKALRLADNKTAELADWDEEKLQAELDDLKSLGVDMDGFGFSAREEAEKDLADFMKDTEEANEPKVIICPRCGEEFIP